MLIFRRLLGFLKPYKRGVTWSFVLAFGAMGTTVLIPYLTGRAVDAISNHDHHGLVIWAIAIGAAGLARLGLSVFRRLVPGRVSLGVEVDLPNLLYGRLQQLELSFFDRQQTGQLMSRATVDLQSVRFFLGYGLIFFFQHVFTIVGVCVLLFIASWKPALVVLFVAPILVAIAYRYSNVSHPVLRDVQQKMADVATVAEENIVGVHVVKAFAQEQAEQDKFEPRSETLFRQSVRANQQRAFYVPLLAFLPLLAQAAVLL